MIHLTLPSQFPPRSYDVLIASTHIHASYQPELSERTKDAISRPDPKVRCWSTIQQRPTRTGQRLSSHCTIMQILQLNVEGLSVTLSVYRSRFEALPSIGSAIFAEHTVKRSNNATDNGHIYARGFADDCYGLGCDL